LYILYAPPSKFGKLPSRCFPVSHEVEFTHNIAYCPKFYWKKHHELVGMKDITPRYMRKLRQNRHLDNILLIATGGLGDAMWCLPFAKELKNKYPKAKIVIAADKRCEPLFRNLPYIAGVVSQKAWNLSQLIRVSDEVYDFAGIATILKKEKRLDPIEATFKLGELPLPKEKARCRPHLVATLDEGKKAESILAQHGISTWDDTIITIALDSSTPNRNWPYHYTQQLTNTLLAEGKKVVWLSEKKDLSNTYIFSCPCGWEMSMTLTTIPAKADFTCPICGNILQIKEFKQPYGVANLCGQTDIRTAMAIIALSDAFIGPNSGLMVISTAFKIPSIGLFGAFSPTLRAKFYEHFTPIWGKTPCAPCNEHWTECPHGHPAPCMKIISPDKVHTELKKLLTKYPRTALERNPIQ